MYQLMVEGSNVILSTESERQSIMVTILNYDRFGRRQAFIYNYCLMRDVAQKNIFLSAGVLGFFFFGYFYCNGLRLIGLQCRLAEAIPRTIILGYRLMDRHLRLGLPDVDSPGKYKDEIKAEGKEIQPTARITNIINKVIDNQKIKDTVYELARLHEVKNQKETKIIGDPTEKDRLGKDSVRGNHKKSGTRKTYQLPIKPERIVRLAERSSRNPKAVVIMSRYWALFAGVFIIENKLTLYENKLTLYEK
ncbi:hypothetical protein H8356DRAFT_1330756 [Neocallimastix lanati (nom. inval.)]|nr:hypothetical protein H8356DRAFT_1330756 [Neocallimastix sp. JGI-2020a]